MTFKIELDILCLVQAHSNFYTVTDTSACNDPFSFPFQFSFVWSAIQLCSLSLKHHTTLLKLFQHSFISHVKTLLYNLLNSYFC